MPSDYLPGIREEGTLVGRRMELYRSCKICGTDRLKPLFSSKGLRLPVVRCRECGLVFVGKVLDVDEQVSFYNDAEAYRAYAEAERAVPKVNIRHQQWLSEIERRLSDSSEVVWHAAKRRPRLLDIGCGSGDFLAAAKARGFEIHGVEISKAAVELAAEWHAIEVDVRPVEDDPRNGFFDVVTLVGVLEHTLNPKTMLEQAHRLLGAGGILFIYTPVWGVYDRLTALLASMSGGRFTKPIDRRINQSHLQIFSRASLLGLLRQVSLEPLSSATICEYNLPVQRYVQSLGLTQPRLQSWVTKGVQVLIDRKVFFRNNMRVIARKR